MYNNKLTVLRDDQSRVSLSLDKGSEKRKSNILDYHVCIFACEDSISLKTLLAIFLSYLAKSMRVIRKSSLSKRITNML